MAPIKRALISVSDKNGVVELAQELQKLGIEIISTGGTAKLLKEGGVKVKKVAQVTKSPEILRGRVKSLHPMIHGAILADRDMEEDMAELKKHKITPIDLLVINFYPFEKAAEAGDLSDQDAVEVIDVGGPTMVRAGAKNFHHVTVLTERKDYKRVLNQIKKNGDTSLATRRKLSIKAFEKTSHYDRTIAEFFTGHNNGKEMLDLHYEKAISLRYGENPHQKAAFFRNPANQDANVTNAKVLQGKQLSFNNIIDTDCALELVKEFNSPAVAIIKHANPCGVAMADKIEVAFKKAHCADEVSAFGCVIAMNRVCNEKIVEYICKKRMFVEIIVATSFTHGALAR